MCRVEKKKKGTENTVNQYVSIIDWETNILLNVNIKYTLFAH